MISFLSDYGVSQAELVGFIVAKLPGFIAALMAIVFFVFFYLASARLIEATLKRTHMQPSLVQVTVRSLYKWAIFILGAIMVLSQLGINVTAALAGVGVAGIAIGLAAKETLSNIMAGFGIFIDHLYKRGDWVNIAGNYGQVKDITLRTTKIRTLDNIFVVVPNAQVTQNPVTNYSEEGMVRISVDVGIAYKESIDEAREVLLAAAAGIEGALLDPAPTVVVQKLGDSSVDLQVRMWVADAGTDPFYRFTLTEVCKKALDAAGISIPFPQRDIHTSN